jgi:hypothetical protein
MPTTCPAGHDTASTDFCDVCGMRIGGSARTQASAPAPAPGPPGGQGEYCPRCRADRRGQFCEACGYSLASGPPERPLTPSATFAPAPAAPATQPAAAPGRVSTAPSYVATVPSHVTPGTGDGAAAAEWTAVATADRAYFDSVVATAGPDAPAVQFPDYCPERRFRLFGPEMRIGRRSPSRGLEPEIDLTGPPADPGVSHLHAVLIADEDGGWIVLDPGSANGTLVNGTEMAPGSRVRLHDGDRISLGAWTVLTIRVT